MARIKLLEIEATNFRSYKHLKLSSLDNRGLVLIAGDNGSGKSVIRHAIEYLLLDTTSDGIDLSDFSLDKKGDCGLYCKLQRDNDIIEISKYRDHSLFQNRTILTINGDSDLTKTDRRETKKDILTLLKVDDNLIFSSTIFSQNSISFVESREDVRKEVLYGLLNDSLRYEEANIRAKEGYKKLTEELLALDRNLYSKKSSIDEYIEQLRGFSEQEENYKIEREKKILLEEDQVKKLIFERQSLKKQLKTIKSCDIAPLEKLLQPSKKDSAVDEINLKERLLIKKITETKVRLQDNQLRLKNLINKTCPILNIECDRLTLEQRMGLELKIGNLLLEIRELNKGITLLLSEKNILVSKINKENEKIEEHNAALLKSIGKAKEINERISLLKREIEIKKRDVLLSNHRLLRIKKEKFDLIDFKNKTKTKIRILMEEVSSLENRIAYLKEIIPYYKFWITGYSPQGIPNLKIEGMLDRIESTVNTNLSQIYPGTYVILDSQSSTKKEGDYREKISYKIHNRNNSIISYKSYSMGQRQRIKVADLFTFFEILSPFDFIFFDEMIEMGLDQSGVDNILRLLREKISTTVGTIFVVSNNTFFKGKFDSVISVQMKDGVSYIE